MKNNKKQSKKKWRKVELRDFIFLNPVTKMIKGEKYPFLDMADVKPLSRTTKWPKTKIFNGSGARFKNGDTLFARITPCLENGKITQVLNISKEGFGSTEFIVLREKPIISNKDFIFYLSRTRNIRKLAEQSMVGASGRQRVDRRAFEEIEVFIPENIGEQKRIAGILSSFDDKIELNNKINENLEQTAQAIFKEWFIGFKFPGHQKVKMVDSELGKIPEGWEVKKITKIIKRLPTGKKYDNKTALPKGKTPILDQGQSAYIGFHDGKPGVKADIQNPVAVFTNHTCNYRLMINDFSCIQNVLPYTGIGGYLTLFVYYLTRGKIKMNDYKGHWPEFEEQIFAIPPVKLVQKFSNLIESLIIKKDKTEKENQKLIALRDLLLPKLMSGEIRV